jgi:spore germination protein KA
MVPAGKKQKIVQEKSAQLNLQLEKKLLSKSLDKNIKTLKELFADDDTLVTRYVTNNYAKNINYYIAYVDPLVNSFTVNEDIIKPLMHSQIQQGENIEFLLQQVILISEAKKVNNYLDIVNSITYGDTVLLAEGSEEALILNTKGFAARGIAEPDNEKVLSGPREGFAEALLPNLCLIRRRLRTNDLKLKYYTLGTRTNTTVCICYLNSLVNHDLLQNFTQRLTNIDIDGVLDTQYIKEFLKDSPYSLFRTIGSTERPDSVVAKLLEGRIAIFLDGTPVVLTIPYLFIENFQSSEDYYINFYYTSFTRLLRIISFFITIALPAAYIATVAFSREMIPTQLLINIASERTNVPLSAAAEALIMLILFALLKETGVRMPSNLGQALSIVGALVIGQAAVEAKLIASPMIIVVALTGISGLLVTKLNPAIIYLQVFLLLFASTLGFYGLSLGLCFILIHLLNLHSFGVPQITLSGELQTQELKDIPVRAPWWNMRTRPKAFTRDINRMKPKDGDNEQ